ncbi:MAG: glucose-1-phosphate adenylyltransferase [Chloroflexi bacterium]|nr:glucose-1-phosphate adenylyltransferase [Chloroflexota bacterium]
MNRVLALILAGGAGERLSLLCHDRAKPAVPFAGKYRIIDFALSNCANSGIYKLAVLTQYNPFSLADHIGNGHAWGFDRRDSAARLLHPYRGFDKAEWYRDTGDAVYQNLFFVEEQQVDEVLILGGDHVYMMRYNEMSDFHRHNKADVTVGVVTVAPEETSRFGIVILGEDNRIKEFEEKPVVAKSNLASTGIYIFSKQVLMKVLDRYGGKATGSDFGRDIVPSMLDDYRVYAFRMKGYWRDVGAIQAYWETSMDLLREKPPLNMYDVDQPVLTIPDRGVSAKVGRDAVINLAMLSNNCIVDGEVRNSVLSPGVRVERGARVIDSIIFNDSIIRSGATVDRSIVDKNCTLGPDSYIGYGDDLRPNTDEPGHLNTGITLVGKGAKVKGGVKVGRNCKIGCYVEPEDFDSDFVQSGASMHQKTPKRFHI